MFLDAKFLLNNNGAYISFTEFKKYNRMNSRKHARYTFFLSQMVKLGQIMLGIFELFKSH